MKNQFGSTPAVARLAAIGVSKRLGPDGFLHLANQIQTTGVGSAPVNRQQRRFEERMAKKINKESK